VDALSLTRGALAQQSPPQSVLREQVGLLQDVLSLVQRGAPSVKRFVLTSSLSAILPMEGGPLPNLASPGNGYNETDWNPVRVARPVDKLTEAVLCRQHEDYLGEGGDWGPI